MLYVIGVTERLPQWTAGIGMEDTSDLQCEALLQPALPALPASADQLAAILFARPVHAMPVHQDVFNSLIFSSLKQMFVVDNGSAVTLARIISNQLASDTAYNVNMSLITPLFHLDALASDSYLGFTPERDQGDPDSIMASLSKTTASLRPDGVLRGRDGQKLLMKWEERADGLAEAVADLKGVVLSVLSCLLSICALCAVMSSVHMCSLCYHVFCP